MIVAGGTITWYLFSSSSTNALYNRSLHILNNSAWVKSYVGPDLHAITGAGRGNQIPEKEYLQRGILHRSIVYYIKGNYAKGRVTCVFIEGDVKDLNKKKKTKTDNTLNTTNDNKKKKNLQILSLHLYLTSGVNQNKTLIVIDEGAARQRIINNTKKRWY